MPEQPKLARVLFDELHSEAWSIRPERARAMQPAHPGDASLAAAAAALASRDFEVMYDAPGPLTAQLAQTDLLVIPHPSDPKWEATTNLGSPRFTDAEMEEIERWVAGGGGLIVLAETENEKYGNNLNDLLARFGLHVENATVQDYEHHREAPSWILADLSRPDATPGADLLARVDAACFYRAGTLSASNGAAVLARTHDSASAPGEPLLAVTEHGRGRVVVLADSDLFGDDCIDELSHRDLWLNLAYWASARAFASADASGSRADSDPVWLRLKAAVSELRLMQEPDGSIDLAAHDRDRAAHLAEQIASAAAELTPRFPHQSAYISALGADLRDWAAQDFPRPAFDRAIEAFRPEQDRRDGIEHLVVFPMYKQNASSATCFEALIVRVPWPEFVDEIERGGYDNPKFLPVNLVDYTDGYDSECAVLFPETFSARERPPAHFGAIFCDREAERLRRVAGAAAAELHLNLPPDAACLLASPELSEKAYILWDLIHDRTHMRGDLPFDPFMIRQRSPYWMYALEELRCDLTAFAESVKLEAAGFPFARYVQYAIVFDRLFRFPVTGNRVRNYDGLGGQLLFAFLHKEGYLHWTDSRLTIDWNRLPDGVNALRDRVQDLYHSGIDRSKLSQWIAAHDLVSEYVPPAESSVWAAARRDLPEVEEPKQLVDLVRDDEFPLSLFYSQLRPRLEPALAARPTRESAAAPVASAA